MTTVYLSSTYEDLKDHRQAVFDALRKAGYTVIAMEDYVAADERPVDKCLKDVTASDIYVGLYAFRYGYVPPVAHGNPDGLSITELEFRCARVSSKPSFAFVVDEKAAWPPVYMDAIASADKGERISKLRQHLLTEKLASKFSLPHELASLVQAAITKHLEGTRAPASPAAPAAVPSWDIAAQGSPFPGLMHFTRPHAPVFFGREADVRAVLDRLHSGNRFLVVSGDSGTGKSSLVDAGVLPRLEAGALPGGGACAAVRMVPSQGADPFDAFARVLHAQAERVRLDPFKLGGKWLTAPATLVPGLQKIASGIPGLSALVLFLDQMEELFSGHKTDAQKQTTAAFLESIHAAAVREQAIWVIATLRSDFLHHCHHHPRMLEVLRGSGHYPLGRAEPYMMRDMIALPAQSAGLEIPEGLVSRLVRETGSAPGNLPMLAFVLERLYSERQGRTLSEAVYESFGGVAGAIAAHVCAVEEDLRAELGDAALARVPSIFPSLLKVDAAGLPTRRRVPHSTFAGELEPLVDRLVRARLLSTEGEGEGSTVSVAHERLFTAWPALARWIAENHDDLRMLRQAEGEAADWSAHGHAVTHLWHVDRLKRLQAVLARFDDATVADGVRSFAQPQRALIDRLRVPYVTIVERAAICETLSALGDERAGVGLRPDGVPDMDWVAIPAGTIELEGGQGVFYVPAFEMARYPVTNRQFQAFIDAADGYNSYDIDNGLQDLKCEIPEPPIWSEPNRPRESVTWHQAMAFCRWLSTRLGREVRLPAEWEWQQAATGGNPANVYPWGPNWDARLCNSSESGLGRTTPVGMYPAGASVQGVLDLAGNVCEWCLNAYEERGNVSLERDLSRVLRGGGWLSNRVRFRAAFRIDANPRDFSNYVGFRLCRSSPIE